MCKGKLFLIPVYLSETNDSSFIAPMVREVLRNVDYFLVENVRTSMRFVRSQRLGIDIKESHFEVLNKKTERNVVRSFFAHIRKGKDIGLMSDAGMPCLADPGNLAVSLAHQNGIHVVPLPGASSISMALMASGFNGQQFTFNGYLPIDRRARVGRVKELEQRALGGFTQLFMETPYRNHQLLGAIIKNCHPHSLLSIAADISGTREFILTQSISKWEATDVQIHKVPSIFSFGQYPNSV